MSRTKEQWIAETGGFPLNQLLRFTSLLPAPRASAVPEDELIFWDVETDPIVFGGPPPKPRVACVSDISGRRRRVYRPAEFSDLHRDLRKAGAAVSFNGNHFDLKVLASHLGLSVRALGIKSFDLLVAIERACQRKHNLNNLAYVNLKEPKRSLGIAKPRTFRQQVQDCHSDVSQLRRLFRLFVLGKLRVPTFAQAFTNKEYRKMPFGGQCPVCNDVASINELPAEKEEKELDAAMLAAVIGNLPACRELVGVEQACRCFTCATVFL